MANDSSPARGRRAVDKAGVPSNRKKSCRVETATHDSGPTTSVVIPTYENFRLKHGSLSLVLSALSRCRPRPDEVVVVDNDSTEASAAYVRRLCRTHEATFLTCSRRASPAAARNIGIRSCTGEVVVFIDDDTVVPSHALGYVHRLTVDGSFCAGADRRYVPMDMERERVHAAFRKSGFDGLVAISKALPVPASMEPKTTGFHMQQVSFITNFGAALREHLIEVGALNEEFTGWGVEDTELMLRLLMRTSFRSMRGLVPVVHLDHPVSPYMWTEHWANTTKFMSSQRAIRRNFMLSRLFTRKHVERGDRHVLVPSFRRRARMVSGPTRVACATDWRARVEQLAHRVSPSSVIIHGSVGVSDSPADIDVIVLSPARTPRRFEVERDHHPPVEICHESLPKLEYLSRHPHLLPESWLWEFAKVMNGSWFSDPLHQRVRVRTAIEAAQDEARRFLVTHAIGLMVELESKIRRGRCDDYSNRPYFFKYLAAIWFALHKRWPESWYFPYAPDLPLHGWYHVLRGATDVHSSSVSEALASLLRNTRDLLAKDFDCSQGQLRRAMVYPSNLDGLIFFQEHLGIRTQHLENRLSLAISDA